MGKLQKMFDKMLADALDEESLAVLFCKRQLSKQKIELTDEQMAVLRKQVSQSLLEGDGISIDIEEIVGEDFDAERIEAEMEGKGAWTEFESGLGATLQEGLTKLMESAVQDISEELHLTAPAMLEGNREDRNRFEQILRQKWGKSLNSLEIVIKIANECGDEFNKEWRPKAAHEQDLVFDVLTRLHARGCQVAQEVLVLLKAGFADGAHARWRTLHEITTVAMFVAQSGNDVANRYLLHDGIESYKAIVQQAEHAQKLGLVIEQQEVDRFKNRYDQLLAQFGQSYRHEYGWASDSSWNEKPNFSDIEEAVSLNHMRPYYKLASHNVHANPKGALFKLGLLPDRPPILLAGTSDAGLADPGASTATSISQLTITLLATKPEIDTVVHMRILSLFAEECKDTFMEEHRKYQEEADKEKERRETELESLDVAAYSHRAENAKTVT